MNKQPFDRFTDRAKHALVSAKAEAQGYQHSYIGTEHLVLALTKGDGVAAKVLAGLGLNEDRVRGAVDHVVEHGTEPSKADIAFTPRAKRVIDLAVEESRGLHHSYVGTEHLLLGMLRADDPDVKESLALRVIESLGASPDKVRHEILRVLSTATESPQARGYVVTCRVDERTLNALDELVEAGVYTTRSEAAARLIAAGMHANQPLLERVHVAVAEIRRVREETQALARQWEAHDSATGPEDAERNNGSTLQVGAGKPAPTNQATGTGR